LGIAPVPVLVQSLRQLSDGGHLGPVELYKDNPTNGHQKGSFADRVKVQSERNRTIRSLAILKANISLGNLQNAIESPYTSSRYLQWLVLATEEGSFNKKIHMVLAVLFSLEQEKVKDYMTHLT